MADARSPSQLLQLPPELLMQIFQALPTLDSALALRKASHKLDQVYMEHEKAIKKALRDTLVAPFYQYYRFLTTLHIAADSLQCPPPEGWPDVTAEEYRYRCSDFTTDVFKHLPRLDSEQNVDYKSFATGYVPEPDNGDPLGEPYFDSYYDPDDDGEDYAWDDGGDDGLIRLQQGGSGDEEEQLRLKRIVRRRYRIDIARGYESGGVALQLDTMKGLIYERIIRMDSLVHDVASYFERKQEEFIACRSVFIPDNDSTLSGYDVEPYDAEKMEKQGEPDMTDNGFGYDDDDYLWIRHLYFKFGWPAADWRKKEGLQAISDYKERRENALNDEEEL
ncbi:hypothetical protein GQ53DRAFT_743993 [Thozetella sp. PMI_491]|nr:hypothetical protein GQ53DRAFT_743993 [Thozetella sp. PMI_491]